MNEWIKLIFIYNFLVKEHFLTCHKTFTLLGLLDFLKTDRIGLSLILSPLEGSKHPTIKWDDSSSHKLVSYSICLQEVYNNTNNTCVQKNKTYLLEQP